MPEAKRSEVEGSKRSEVNGLKRTEVKGSKRSEVKASEASKLLGRSPPHTPVKAPSRPQALTEV